MKLGTIMTLTKEKEDIILKNNKGYNRIKIDINDTIANKIAYDNKMDYYMYKIGVTQYI